ncbi:DUF6415 family natural product biosynthesis protein [Streptomyces sp. NPDC051217]|uniref:DUF6415 family natural product biosynthesis protein n=1 Tax=Streptomyces sp. NPDC051217 TaxID=3365644 RepID=UPI00378C6A1B
MDETTYPAMQSTVPLDISTMSAAAAALLDDEPPAGEALTSLTLQLRGHLNLLIPELEQRCDVAEPRDVACAQRESAKRGVVWRPIQVRSAPYGTPHSSRAPWRRCAVAVTG